jgi:hypothetical protein
MYKQLAQVCAYTGIVQQKLENLENQKLYYVCTAEFILVYNVHADLYRVAVLFPERFLSFTMAFQFVFLNNSFRTHCLSFI